MSQRRISLKDMVILLEEASLKSQTMAVKHLPSPTKAVAPMCLHLLGSRPTQPRMLRLRCKAQFDMYLDRQDTPIQAVLSLHPAARTPITATAARALGAIQRARPSKSPIEVAQTQGLWGLLANDDCFAFRLNIRASSLSQSRAKLENMSIHKRAIDSHSASCIFPTSLLACFPSILRQHPRHYHHYIPPKLTA